MHITSVRGPLVPLPLTSGNAQREHLARFRPQILGTLVVVYEGWAVSFCRTLKAVKEHELSYSCCVKDNKRHLEKW